MTKDDLTKEANKLQYDLLALIELSPVSPIVKPLLRAVVGRLHVILCGLIWR